MCGGIPSASSPKPAPEPPKKAEFAAQAAQNASTTATRAKGRNSTILVSDPLGTGSTNTNISATNLLGY